MSAEKLCKNENENEKCGKEREGTRQNLLMSLLFFFSFALSRYPHTQIVIHLSLLSLPSSTHTFSLMFS